MKIESLFPVQKQIIPIINNSEENQSIYPNDICVLAPTGSGKTLSYVIPIIKSLKRCMRPACRAIVILPVGDLAEQVYKVVDDCLKDPENKFLKNDDDDGDYYRPLKAILLSNKTPFSKEQAHLIDREHEKCLVDIVISTPGRLVDHLQKTPEFDISELRYLVIDECDRIVEHIKQNWLDILGQEIFVKRQRKIVTNDHINVHNLFESKERLVPIQKLLFSATLTKNPEKLEPLKLFQPLYFSVSSEEKTPKIDTSNKTVKTSSEVKPKHDVTKLDEVSLPNTLKECFMQTSLQEKPLVAIYLLKMLNYRPMLCFVKSKDSAKRLNRLLQINGLASMEYSSSLHAARRTRIKTKFEQSKLDVLVCSDVMARGMDLPNVDYVLLYDAPIHLNSYVHKVGRTARAGRQGTSITFLERKQVHSFKSMLENIEPDHYNKLTKLETKNSDLAELINAFQNSLVQLKEEFNKTK